MLKIWDICFVDYVIYILKMVLYKFDVVNIWLESIVNWFSIKGILEFWKSDFVLFVRILIKF